MDWESNVSLEGQVTYWRAVGKPEWADALEQCLAKAERCQTRPANRRRSEKHEPKDWQQN